MKAGGSVSGVLLISKSRQNEEMSNRLAACYWKDARTVPVRNPDFS